MRFFHPTEAFWEWAEKNIKNDLIIDCGCGDGDLVREMGERGFKCMGIDPRYSIFNESVPIDLMNRVLIKNAEESSIVQNTKATLLVCRPCHSGFPSLVRDVMRKDSRMFYIGFDKNLFCDLAHPVEKILENAGQDEEELYLVK